MVGRRTTEQKLDMALDELVDRRPTGDEYRGRPGLRSYGEREQRDSWGPYDRRDAGNERREGGKGKGKRRMSPERKALLNTHCFFDSDGDFVVRLYDTKVVTLSKQPAAITVDGESSKPAEPAAKSGNAAEDGQPPADGEAKPATPPAAVEEGAANGDSKEKQATPPAAVEEGPADGDSKATGDAAAAESGVVATKADVAASPGGMVVTLASGRFKTLETRHIINEVLGDLGLRVTESDGHWEVGGSSLPSRPFEDGMKISLSDSFERASVVQEHMVAKIASAKERDAVARTRPHHPGDYGPSRELPPRGMGYPPPPLHPGHLMHHRPPPGWPHGPPPPGWPATYGLARPPHPYAAAPPHPYGAPPLGAYRDAARGHPPPAHSHPQQPPPQAAPAGSPAAPQPAGPLPDSMFQ